MLTTFKNSFLKKEGNDGVTPSQYFERLIQNTFETFMADLYPSYLNLGLDTQKNENGSITISIDVPGFKEENLSIEMSDRQKMITVKGEVKANSYTRYLNKSFSLPEGYDVDTLKAELANGVLSLTLNPLPSSTENPVKKIEIKSINSLPEKSD